jgi:hypothetical protein
VPGPTKSTESLDRHVAKREELTAAEHMQVSEEYSHVFNGWIYGWRSTATHRRTRSTEFKDLFDGRKRRPIPKTLRRFHQQPVLDCELVGVPVDGNALRNNFTACNPQAGGIPPSERPSRELTHGRLHSQFTVTAKWPPVPSEGWHKDNWRDCRGCWWSWRKIRRWFDVCPVPLAARA